MTPATGSHDRTCHHPKDQKEVWSDLVRAAANWREEIMIYFETDISVTNAYIESFNRLAKDNNRC